MPDALALGWRQYRLERRMFWRNPTAAFFNFVFPLIFLGLFGAVFHGDRKELDIVIPGIAGMSVMSTTFTALAMNMTFLREDGVLKRMRGTPLPGVSYLGAIAANALTNAAIQLVIVVVSGRVLFGIGWPRDVLELAVFGLCGVVCFASLGVAFSHAIPNFDSAPAYVNAVFLPLLFISGVFFDAKHSPAFLRDLGNAFPLTHLVTGLKDAMVVGHGVAHELGALASVAGWALAGILLAVRGFSWEQRRS